MEKNKILMGFAVLAVMALLVAPHAIATDDPSTDSVHATAVDADDSTDTNDNAADTVDANDATDDSDENIATDDAEVLTSDDEREVKAMHSRWGARMRLLQLQRKIQWNVFTGEKIIDYIQENHEGKDVSDLKSILDDMGSLIDDLKKINTESESKEDMVKHFVETKKEARQLAKDFRDNLREILSEDEIATMKEKIQSQKEDDSELDAEIDNARHEYNAEFMADTLESLGETDESLVDSVRNGDLSTKEVRDALLERFRKAEPEQKRHLMADIQHNINERADIADTAMNYARNFHGRFASDDKMPVASAGRVPELTASS